MNELVEIAVSPRVEEGQPVLRVYREDLHLETSQWQAKQRVLAAFGPDRSWEEIESERTGEGKSAPVPSEKSLLHIGFDPKRLVKGATIEVPTEWLEGEGKVAIGTPILSNSELKTRLAIVGDGEIHCWRVRMSDPFTENLAGLAYEGFFKGDNEIRKTSFSHPFFVGDDVLCCVGEDWNKNTRVYFSETHDELEAMRRNNRSYEHSNAPHHCWSSLPGDWNSRDRMNRGDYYTDTALIRKGVTVRGLTAEKYSDAGEGSYSVLIETNAGFFHGEIERRNQFLTGVNFRTLVSLSNENAMQGGKQLPFNYLDSQKNHPLAEIVKKEDESCKVEPKPKEKVEGFWAKIISDRDKTSLCVGKDNFQLSELEVSNFLNLRAPQAIAISEFSKDFKNIFRVAVVDEVNDQNFTHIWDVEADGGNVQIGYAGVVRCGKAHGKIKDFKITADGQVCLGKDNGDVFYAKVASATSFETNSKGMMVTYKIHENAKETLRKKGKNSSWASFAESLIKVIDEPVSTGSVVLCGVNVGNSVTGIKLEPIGNDDAPKIPTIRVKDASGESYYFRFSKKRDGASVVGSLHPTEEETHIPLPLETAIELYKKPFVGQCSQSARSSDHSDQGQGTIRNSRRVFA